MKVKMILSLTLKVILKKPNLKKHEWLDKKKPLKKDNVKEIMFKPTHPLCQ